MEVVIKCNFERKVHYEKLLVLIMAALMILAMAVAGCGGDDKADNGSTAHKEKLVIGTDADINNLNLQNNRTLPTTLF